MEEKIIDAVAETVEEPKVKLSPLAEKANEALEECKSKFNVVLIIGLDDKGRVDINCNLPQYPTMQYMINRAGFELLVHEKNAVATV